MIDQVKQIAMTLDAAKQKAYDDLDRLFQTRALQLLQQYPEFAKFVVHPYGEYFCRVGQGEHRTPEDELPPDCLELLEAVRFAYSGVGLEQDGEIQLLVLRSDLPAEPQKRSCNRHADCDLADARARQHGARAASHCHDDCCEDCFGS
jgi:hypothetical protein